MGPLAWNRALNHSAAKELLSKTLKTKWEEATTGPPRALKEELEGGDEEFRHRLFLAQGKCPELEPTLEACKLLLGARQKDSTQEAERQAKDYRLNSEDGVLERAVFVTKVIIWVPVLPTTEIPTDCFPDPQGSCL